MSDMGHKQTSEFYSSMSGFGGKTDVGFAGHHVRF